MKRFYAFSRPVPPSARDASGDALARLLLAAKEDAAFRVYLTRILHLPAGPRQSLINTALHEMTLRGEPAEIRAAFASLIAQEAADHALAFLGEPVHAHD